MAAQIWTQPNTWAVPREGRHFPPSSAEHWMMSWFVEGWCWASPTEFQTHIEGVLASFDSTTPHKDMQCWSACILA